jgi:hypothetical protein
MAATYDLISAQTFTNNSNTCTFNSFSGYTDLVIQGNITVPTISTGFDLYVRFNGDNASNYDTLGASSTSTYTFDNTYVNAMSAVPIVGLFNSPTNATIQPMHFELTIPEYSNSSNRKNGTGTFSYIADESSGRTNTGFLVWHWRNTNAITSITVSTSSGSNMRGTINLYGITAGNA